MPQTFNPAFGYNLLDDLVRAAEPRVRQTAPALLGYDPDVVAQRTLQRLTELALPDLIEQLATRHEQHLSPLATDAGLDCGRVRFAAGRRQVSVSPGLWARSVFEFAAQWVRVLAIVIHAAIAIARPVAPVRSTLLFGVGMGDLQLDGSDRRFAEFCRNGPIEPLRSADHIVVECGSDLGSTTPDRVSYSAYPLFDLARRRAARGIALLRFLGAHFAAAAQFLATCVARPRFCVLSRDVALHALVKYLDQAGALASIVVTNSHYHAQPLWMRGLPRRGFSTHMVWYSQNSTPFVYRDDGVRSYLPNLRHIEVDDIWVWTSAFGESLQRLGASGRVHAVGPILWYLPVDRPRRTDPITVTIFDVTPVRQAVAREIGLTRNYYATDNMVAFLGQAIDACEHLARAIGKPVLPILKHKRSHGEVHDPEYLAFVDGLVTARRVQLVAPQTSLYELIGGSAATIVVPWSSPAYVASHLGVSAIYFDATGSIADTHERAPHVEFASKQAVLEDLLARAASGTEVATRHG